MKYFIVLLYTYSFSRLDQSQTNYHRFVAVFSENYPNYAGFYLTYLILISHIFIISIISF